MTNHDYKAAIEAFRQLPWGYYCAEPSLNTADGYYRAEKETITAAGIAALELAINPPDAWQTGVPPVNGIGLSEPLNFIADINDGKERYLALGHFNADKNLFIETDGAVWLTNHITYWQFINLPAPKPHQPTQGDA